MQVRKFCNTDAHGTKPTNSFVERCNTDASSKILQRRCVAEHELAVKLAVKLEIKFQYESTYAWTECGKKETPHKLQSRKKKEKRDRPPPLASTKAGEVRRVRRRQPTPRQLLRVKHPVNRSVLEPLALLVAHAAKARWGDKSVIVRCLFSHGASTMRRAFE